jgi:hypothetical protein
MWHWRHGGRAGGSVNVRLVVIWITHPHRARLGCGEDPLGAGAEFVRPVEVEAGGYVQIAKVFRGDVAGPWGMVAGGAGGFHGD